MDRRRFTLALAGTAALPHTVGRAQAWPDKPVRVILSQPAGAGPDIIARTITEQLARRWNQPVVVENRPGGQNAIGAQAAARATPDGYTFYFATAAALVTNAYLFKSLPYDPRKDFAPVGLVGVVPFAVSVAANSPLKTWADLLAYARANPGRPMIANEGPSTFGGLMTRLIGARAGLQWSPVPYVSVAAAVNDTIGGTAEAVISDLPSVAQMAQGGRMRILAVTTDKRVAGWESVPPLADTLPGFDFAGWTAFVAPAGTPAAAIQRFNRDLEAVLATPEVNARIRGIGPLVPGPGTPEQFGAFLAAEHARWAKLSGEIGLIPE